ncbi:MAG TPA: hypothetical protein ENN17_06160 [bacterium]|nr:hypothetical protein [bacterium]
MKRGIITAAILICLMARIQIGYGQSLQERLESLTQDNARRYLQPMGDALGANLNSGFYHSAKVGGFGLHVYVGVEIIGAVIGEDQKTYTAKILNTSGQIMDQPDVPTIFGPKGGKNVSSVAGQSYTLPGGTDLGLFPIIAPRIQIGNIMGTELVLRWVETNLPQDLGKFSMKGYGLRHSLSQYIPLSPVHFSFGVFLQDVGLGDAVRVTTSYFGVQASKRFMALEIYGGAGIESSTLKAEYRVGPGVPGADPGQKIAFSLDGANSTRLNVGMTLHMLLFKVHADYNIAAQKTVVIGVGLGL